MSHSLFVRHRWGIFDAYYVSNNNYQHLTVRNLYNEGEIEVEGISFSTSKNEAEKLVIQLQPKLRPLEYSVFISKHTNNKICKVGVIKGNDQFEILKIQRTNGDNYDIGNDDVIDKLKEWNRKYPFTIIGADYDWVEAYFKVIPNDKELKSFAQEIYEFCPDIVDQGIGSIESLMQELKETKKLYLWWD